MRLTKLRRGLAGAAVSAVIVAVAVAVPVAVAGPGRADASAPVASQRGPVVAVGAENEYADVIRQVGGRYVHVAAILSNPNTDPHSFEASPSVAKLISSASLVVQNGVGYDDFMTKIEQAAPAAGRKVIDVQTLRGLPSDTANPHLWYSPQTMPLVAEEVANDLALLRPAHAAYFQANATRFVDSLTPWYRAIARFAKAHPRVPVAATEPVAGYLLSAAGARDLSPASLELAIMNGTDPAPQDVSALKALLTGHKVKALLYNEQVTDPLTQSFLATARKAGVPVVSVYETMPTPGFDYQSWMTAELAALNKAVATGTSTGKL